MSMSPNCAEPKPDAARTTSRKWHAQLQRAHPTAIIGVSLWALIRRVVINANSVVIDLGRTQRLFTGHARDAVMLLEPVCVWPGCDQPHTWCHADHLTSWSTRGPTNPDNGAPLCARHNYLKEHGVTTSGRERAGRPAPPRRRSARDR